MRLDITPGEVQQALVQQLPGDGGKTKEQDVQVDLMTDTDLRTAEEFRQLIVREQDGMVVQLADVAGGAWGARRQPAGGLNPEPAVWFSVWPLPSTNELDVARGAQGEQETQARWCRACL